METTEQLQVTSICSELNLKIQDLNIGSLFANPTYRRLYNIVVNDSHKTEYQYRKNLIKQMYFLLKITPIMNHELQDSYLNKLQKWYNNNDAKKTQLGSGRLRNLVDEYCHNKQTVRKNQQQHLIRPQSGVDWNKNVVPFLRPYTATKKNNQKQCRPDSYKSKFDQSTKASTSFENSLQTCIGDFVLSIKQELQTSKDFVNKNRTIHPQSQPIYQQLFNIISKAGVGNNFNKNNQQDPENEVLFQRDKDQFYQNPAKFESNIIEKPIKSTHKLEVKEKQPFDGFQNVSDEKQSDSDDDLNTQQDNFNKKVHTQDLNIQKTDQLSVDGFLHFKTECPIDTLFLQKIKNKYSHLTNNKFVTYSKDDHQLIRNYLNYSRAKSAIKKQSNRKSQARRILSAKSKFIVNLSTQSTKNSKSATPLLKDDQKLIANNFERPPKLDFSKTKVFDLSKNESDKENLNTRLISSPSYNQRAQLDILYRKQIETFIKSNKNSISVAQLRCKEKNLLTKHGSFATREKINPIADANIEKYNQEALEQIKKIKQKIASSGKKGIFTDSLMKALYINSYDDIGSFTQGQQQAAESGFDWRTRNLYFNMQSNGQKKLKKKTRKLKKQ